MDPNQKSRRTRIGIVTAALGALLLVAGGLSASLPASADTQPADPTNPATPPTVGASALPTVQIDGVAWQQKVVGDTVYVAGKFTTARPAGSPAGSNTTPRNNFLAYNVTTGALNTAVNVQLNAQAKTVAASPDGTRVYVGGDFTTANGASYYRIVAINTSTGQIVSSFRPTVSSQVAGIAATDTAVYIGGTFTSVNGSTRTRLAKLNASDGSLVSSWNASADYTVTSLAVSPDGTRVYAGGAFQNVNGASHYGLAKLDATTGAALSFPVNSIVRDAGDNAAITSLAATSDRVYGSGYVFGSGGNLEGAFSADATTGSLVWLEDCHGDTYSVAPIGNVLYAVGHPHMCSNVGGFPETNPRTYHHALGFSKAATHTLTNDGNRSYANFRGQPAPSPLTWYPDFGSGTFTGQGQATWSIAGDSRYVVVGGEFPYVNGKAQYGLTRFAMDDVSRSTFGPNNNTAMTPNATSSTAGQARITWQATFDMDNQNLTYKLSRDGDTAHPVYQVTQGSQFWSRPSMGFTDTGLAGGSRHTYTLTVTDPDGNSTAVTGNSVLIAGGTGNQPPIASFSATASGLSVSFDGRASSDPDGSIASYAWTFGDGGTASGSTTSHTYAAAGTYTATLKVTDNGGASSTTSKSITVTSGTTTALARDAFQRTVSGGWGSADAGGAWTASGSATSFSVASGVGQMVDAAGGTLIQTLGSVSSTRTDSTVTFTTDVAPTGGGVFASALARQVGSASYDGRAWISSSGAVQAQLLRSGTTLTAAVVPGVTYTPGTQLKLRVQAVGTSPTVFQAKVWPAAQAEPAAWQVSVSDSTAGLQSAGSVGLRAYVSGAATTTPVTFRFDDYLVSAVP
ncbi:PKD domain-containing protein [Leifsonia sp. NPDC077715]|uniref:PKD domain-containing protein n=1 Tax=Leifsonia sp. NPDC077715 TaxID=3155539 RepID=UPI003423716C